jgi:Sulfotransferase family
MIISHHHRFIFFHNPKTAGMSRRAVLAHYRDDRIPMHDVFEHLPFVHPLEIAHLRLWEISVLFPSVIELAQGYRSLVFIRDPYRRFVSALDQHFKTPYPNLPLLHIRPQEHALIIETITEQKCTGPAAARRTARQPITL